MDVDATEIPTKKFPTKHIYAILAVIGIFVLMHAVCYFIYWCGGGNFVRDINLGTTQMLSTLMSVFVSFPVLGMMYLD